MTRVSLKYSLISLVGIMTITIIGVVVGIIIPSIHQIITLQKSVQTTQSALEQEYKETRFLRRSVREVGDISQRTDAYKQATIAEGEELRVITELENLASAHRITQTLQVSQVGQKKAGETRAVGRDLPHYVFVFVNQGTFADHVRHLRALEQLPYYILIDSLVWEKPRGTNPANPLVTVKFEGRIFISPFSL